MANKKAAAGAKPHPGSSETTARLPLGSATRWAAAFVVAAAAVAYAAWPELAGSAWRGLGGLAGAAARAAGSSVGPQPRAAEQAAEPEAACADESIACPQWARLGECEKNLKFMSETCALSCGTCGRQVPASQRKKSTCVDDDASCEAWALTGQCVKNSEFMLHKCRKSCGVCGPYGPACERLSDAALSGPGAMNATFERAIAEFPQYAPKVLHRDPFVIEFEQFLSDAEADHIVSLCADSFQRSLAGDKVSSVRTSDQCWCNWGSCMEDPVIKAVEERIAAVTRVPVVNGEFMQIVRYGEGQFYREHHDQNSASWSPQGVRVFTFFMYLNNVPEGGETAFRQLGLKVKPRKGSAILWPSVRDSALDQTEHGTYHEAMPVIEGVKYGANVWLHMHDFRSVSQRHCLFTMKNTEE